MNRASNYAAMGLDRLPDGGAFMGMTLLLIALLAMGWA
jgi:hypothetical protein